MSRLPAESAHLLGLIGRALAASVSPALVVARDGRISAVSAGAERLLGGALVNRQVQEIVGLGWRELALVGAEAESDVVVALSVRAPGRPHSGWRLRPELLRAADGEELAVVAHLEEPIAGAASAARGGSGGAAGGRRSDAAVDFSDLFGDDRQVVATKLAAERFARTRLPILLLAETGTGKDLLARAIHGASPRRDRPFVAINCGALSPHLLESELFGYAPGAFTDARREGHDGKVGAARGGTLFLDEVAEMPGPLQALLLRVLEDGTYFRVGESVPRQADVRLICATCRDLPAMVEDGSYRRDLFFRIAGATLSLPTVRERSDVAGLVRHVFDRLVALEMPDASAPRISRAALAQLCGARWPGNVRQIRTALQYALALSDGGEIRPEHLPRLEAAQRSGRPPAALSERSGPAIAERLDEMELDLVARAVEEADGNLSLAARRLGIARSTLYRHLRRAAPPATQRGRR